MRVGVCDLDAKCDDGDDHLEEQGQRQLPRSSAESFSGWPTRRIVPLTGLGRVGRLESAHASTESVEYFNRINEHLLQHI